MSNILDAARMRAQWIIQKFHSEEQYRLEMTPFDVCVIDFNLLLNVGIANLWDLAIGAGGVAWNNAGSMLGVGSDATAEVATQTDLLDAGAVWKGMEGGFPARAAETVTWRSVFVGGEANFDWREFAVRNATPTLLNRKVSDQGTKVAGQTWTLDLSITLS